MSLFRKTNLTIFENILRKLKRYFPKKTKKKHWQQAIYRIVNQNATIFPDTRHFIILFIHKKLLLLLLLLNLVIKTEENHSIKALSVTSGAAKLLDVGSDISHENVPEDKFFWSYKINLKYRTILLSNFVTFIFFFKESMTFGNLKSTNLTT